MKPIHYIILTIAGVILIIVAFNWNSIVSWFKTSRTIPANPEPIKSDLQKCQDINNSLKDGEPCTICVDVNKRNTNTKGIIKNGECIEYIIQPPIPKAIPNPLPTQNIPGSPTVISVKVITPTGAIIYQQDGTGNFTATPAKLPYGQNTVAYGIVTKNSNTYYHIQNGWLNIKDLEKLGS